MSINHEEVARLAEREANMFFEARPKSKSLFERAQKVFVGGVPMQWMTEWPGAFPVFATRAAGARVEDADGHSYIDFCLGDTGGMFGHAEPEIVDAVAGQASLGTTTMLPNEDTVRVGELLTQQFGLPYWQLAMTATDANRFALRLAREITGRHLIVAFNGCYHGTVDETVVSLEDGQPVSRKGNVGPAFDPAETTRVVEFNDLEALERVLADGEVACVITEPALTNIGMVLPEPGFHKGLRELTRRYGALLLIDETHTISTGPGGYTRAYDLDPDIFVLGKPIASGIPGAVYGMTAEIAEKVAARTTAPGSRVAGIGGTLTANWLTVRAMRTTLERVMTQENYEHMCTLAEQLRAGIESTIKKYDLPWHVTRIGARVEYRYQPTRPKNGTEARSGGNSTVDQFIHLYCLNRGVMVTPMHSMLLVSPRTSAEDVETHNRVFEECVRELTAAS